MYLCHIKGLKKKSKKIANLYIKYCYKVSNQILSKSNNSSYDSIQILSVLSKEFLDIQGTIV